MSDQRTVKTRLIDTVNGFDLHETTDGQRSVFATRAGKLDVVGSAWGPSVEGDWFASRWPDEAVRVADRQAAIEHITAAVEAVAE